MMRKESGSVLIVSLLLLLAMMLISLASIKGSGLQEKMGANLYDRELALQAAEAGLREAEARIRTVIETGTEPLFDGTGGFYPLPDPSSGPTERWEDPATAWAAATTVATGPRNSTPQYIVEDMGMWPDPPGCDQSKDVAATCLSPRYRITARSQAPAAGVAAVTLQSTFRP